MQKYKINKESGYNGHSLHCIKELAKKDNISYLYNPKDELFLPNDLLAKYSEITIGNNYEIFRLFLQKLQSLDKKIVSYKVP